MIDEQSPPLRGLLSAFTTPVFLGLAPILGKFAINAGADPFSVAAIRTVIAVLMLWAIYLLFFRKYIFIYPAGLLGCIVIGMVNGVGSLFYYGGLGLLDASLTQLLNGMYLVFAVLLVRMAGEKVNRRMIVRVLLALAALVILTGFGATPVDWLGVGLMLGSALMFAGTVILSQYVLYEMPSATVTLYVLTTMGVLVTMVWLATVAQNTVYVLDVAFLPILLLGLTTALSRLAMFTGVKLLGSMQTAILAITEIGVAVGLALLFLDEHLTTGQWVGVALMGASILLVRGSDLKARALNPGHLLMANLSHQQFHHIAFHRAFGKEDSDDTVSTLTTVEMQAIRSMMGAEEGPMDPFPIKSMVRPKLDEDADQVAGA